MSTKTAGICASPERTPCTEGPTPTPTRTPTQVLTQQLHPRCQLRTTPPSPGLSYAALDTRWMKATSVWVSSPASQASSTLAKPRSCPAGPAQGRLQKATLSLLIFIYVFTYLSYLSSTYLLSTYLSIFQLYLSSIYLKTKLMFFLCSITNILSNILSESERGSKDLKRTSFLEPSASHTLEWNVCS